MGFKANVLTSSELPPEALEMLRLMVGQVPIIMAVRAGGQLRIPAAELDRAGEWKLGVSVEGDVIIFTASPADAKH